MSAIKSEWLNHGCLNVGRLPKGERPALTLRDHLSSSYGRVPFRVRAWPQRGYKETLWWSERNVPHRYGAAYMLRLDHAHGPALHVGINVEKGFEVRDAAVRRARQLNEPVSQLLLGKSWDWHRALDSLPAEGEAIQHAAGILGVALYCWVEFGRGSDDAQYFLVTPDALYLRGGFKPVGWQSVVDFAQKPRPRKWGRLSVMRPFSLPECSPALQEAAILEVFVALRGIRDRWRGCGQGASPQPARVKGALSDVRNNA